MRSRRGLLDLPTGTEALVHGARSFESSDGGNVGVVTAGLPEDFTVPVQPDRGQVGELPIRRSGGDPVQILHSHPEGPAGATGEQPGQ